MGSKGFSAREAAKLAIVIVIALILVLVLRLAIVKATGVSSPIVVVKGTSMLPTLYYGDLVVVHKVPPGEIEVGDIIVYKSEYRNELVIHRVVKIVKAPQCNPVCYVTKGDNNLASDAGFLEPPYGISYDKVIGVVYGVKVRVNGEIVEAPIRIPYLGLLVLLIR